jgi:hypothetical protein
MSLSYYWALRFLNGAGRPVRSNIDSGVMPYLLSVNILLSIRRECRERCILPSEPEPETPLGNRIYWPSTQLHSTIQIFKAVIIQFGIILCTLSDSVKHLSTPKYGVPPFSLLKPNSTLHLTDLLFSCLDFVRLIISTPIPPTGQLQLLHAPLS